MVNLKLLEQVLLSMTPPEAHGQLSGLFDEMRKNPAQSAFAGIGTVHHAIEAHDLNPCALISGMMIGINLAAASNDPLFIEALEHSIAKVKKAKGENVVPFHMAKAELN